MCSSRLLYSRSCTSFRPDFTYFPLPRARGLVVNHDGNAVLERNEVRTLKRAMRGTVAGCRAGHHTVLECHRICVREDVTDQLIAVVVLGKEVVQAVDEFVVSSLNVFGEVDVDTVGREMIRYAFRIPVIPGVQVAVNKLRRSHRVSPTRTEPDYTRQTASFSRRT